MYLFNHALILVKIQASHHWNYYVMARLHDDVMTWKFFLKYWPFMRAIHWSPSSTGFPSQKASILSACLVFTWTGCWPNTQIASDLTHWGLVMPYGDKRTGSTLAQVMACCLTAPSHYLNQCWLIISKVLWLSCEGNFTRDASIINH